MDIETILNIFKDKIERMDPIDPKYLVSNGNKNGFEELVPIVAQEIKNEINDPMIFDYNVHLGHHFPDMDLIVENITYGLELKSRKNGLWSTNGNSIFESISDYDYEEIYLLFGTKQNDRNCLSVRFKEYWKVTASISVTHSPRFVINMDSDESVFSNAKEYYDLKNSTQEEKITFIQDYLKEHTEGARWYIQRDSSNTITPIPINSLDCERKQQLLAEILILFPHDILQTPHATYSRSHEYLISQYFYYSSSFRDNFSASGRCNIQGNDLPQIINKLIRLQEDIRYLLNTASSEFKEQAYILWDELPVQVEKQSFTEDYKRIIDYIWNQNYKSNLQNDNIESLSSLLF